MRKPEGGRHDRGEGASLPCFPSDIVLNPLDANGDKRILVIGGDRVPFSWLASRRAAKSAADGKGVAQPSSKRDMQITQQTGFDVEKRFLDALEAPLV